MRIMRIVKISSPREKESIARNILLDLPEWFGIESARDNYIEESKNLEFYAIKYKEEYIAFLSLKNSSRDCGEIFVMGTYKKYQNLGAGRLLIEAAVNYCLENNLSMLQVKTLADTHPDKNYKLTRNFYRTNGFREIQVLKDFWDPANPCLLMVKPI